MPIKLTPQKGPAQNRLWFVEVTPPDGGGNPWRSPRPTTIGEVISALRTAGCSQADIDKALRETYALYQQAFLDDRAEEEYGPRLRTALTGERDVPPQPPITEALIAYALFLDGKPESLASVVDTVDYIWRAGCTADELAWAFLRLRKRGWLVMQGILYGLNAEAKDAIAGIIGKDGDRVDHVERLEAWTAAHPP